VKYDMKKPCGACPFKRGSTLRLDAERVDEIGGQFTTGGQASFVCHQTAEIDEENGHFVPKRRDADGPESRHCAGALIFAEKNGTPSQMMRIAHRLGMYDPRGLEPYYDEVYDGLDDMRDHALDADPPPLKSKTGGRKRHARSKVVQDKPRVRGKA
jgi:hypothetical protein